VTATDLDRRLMAAALRLGRRGLGLTWPNPSVACLIVRELDGAPVIVASAVTARGGRPHAETQALAEAGPAARGATAYVTLEPCSHFGKTPPCADALVAAGVARVVVALGDPDPRVAGRGIAQLRQAGIAVVENVLADSAARDHAGHIARVAFGRPHVTLKLAQSADGFVGRRNERVAITGPEANARVHMLRAMSDAVVIGIGTALTDDPLLTVRLPGLEGRSPVRVVFDADLRLPATAALVRTAREVPTQVITTWGADPACAEVLSAAGVVVHRVTPPWLGGTGVNLHTALRELVKLGIGRVLLEGGPTLARAFLARALVDEIVLFESPNRIGPDGLAGLPPEALASFTRTGEGLVGVDRMTTYWRER
jgi:diaminohydroxyphosphoribosylaminopyrimidine deaminase/5-amino-6-(5-phosphoribosylamino)uracil reductase